MWRTNHDPNTGYTFHIGDRVRVTGWYMFHNGKTNINEKHKTDPFYDFNVELVTPAAGLPQPETITLSMVKNSSNQFIFDQTRATGCEYYQARLVRVDDVNITDPNDWAPNATLTVMDKTGRTSRCCSVSVTASQDIPVRRAKSASSRFSTRKAPLIRMDIGCGLPTTTATAWY